MDLSEHSSRAPGSDERHPWEQARARFFLDVLARAHAVRASTRVLDVGAGDAYFAACLLERFPGAEVTAWDPAYTDEDLERARGTQIQRVRNEPEGTWDLITLLDVLEHVEEERPLLERARGLLAPGGRVLVSVPAWPGLFGMHDSRLRHRRRYTPADAQALLERAGYVTLAQGGLFHSLVIPRAVEVALASRLGLGSYAASSLRSRLPLRRLVDAALRADNLLSHACARARIDLPGLSWWALCARSRP